MKNIATYALFAAEMDADRAGPQELRILIDTVHGLRPQLDANSLDHACALLLKLRHLADTQTVAFA